MKTIKQLEKENEILRKKLQEVLSNELRKTMKIPELNIEVTKPIEWTKRFKEIVIPKGFRLIRIWELWFILDGSKYMNEFLGNFKGKNNWFWCEETDYAKKKEYSSGLYLNENLSINASSGNLGISSDDGGVVFARDLK